MTSKQQDYISLLRETSWISLGSTFPRTAKASNIHLTQPQLLDSILKELNLDHDKVKSKSTPVAVSKILHGH